MGSGRGRFQRGFSLVFQVMLVQLFFHTNACFCPVSLHVHFPLCLSFFSFRAVAVNSNSCGPVQWRYRASVQSCVPGFGAHLLFVHTQLVHTQFLHTQLGHTQLVCKCPARNSTVQCKSYICSIVTVLSPSHDIGNEQTMARRQAPTMPEWRPHTRDI